MKIDKEILDKIKEINKKREIEETRLYKNCNHKFADGKSAFRFLKDSYSEKCELCGKIECNY